MTDVGHFSGTVAQMFLIRYHKHELKGYLRPNLWWSPDRSGYTVFVDQAGRYTKEEADSICRRQPDWPLEHEAWPEAQALSMARRVVLR